MKAQEFLKAIGLDLVAKELANPTQQEKILTFVSPVESIMDNPYYALEVHFTNLIYTYGKEAVQEVMEQVLKVN